MNTESQVSERPEVVEENHDKGIIVRGIIMCHYIMMLEVWRYYDEARSE